MHTVNSNNNTAAMTESAVQRRGLFSPKASGSFCSADDDMIGISRISSKGPRRTVFGQSSALGNHFTDFRNPEEPTRIIYNVGFSTVIVSGFARDSELECAVKVISKAKLSTPREVQQARVEIRIHSLLNHPQIVPVVGCEENNDAFFLVTPFTAEGDLFQATQHKTLYELEVRNLATQLISALSFVHRQRIVYGDFKPHNVLLFRDGDSYIAQLCDFGFAEHLNDEGMIKFRALRGTQGYFAPELLQEEIDYNCKVDVFALGVTLFTLLAGYAPYYPAHNFAEPPDLQSESEKRYWGPISEECKDLVMRMIAVDPEQRISCDEAMQHPWFLAQIDPQAAATGPTADLRFKNAADVQSQYEMNGRRSPFVPEGTMTYRFVDGQNCTWDKPFPTPESTACDSGKAGLSPTSGYAKLPERITDNSEASGYAPMERL